MQAPDLIVVTRFIASCDSDPNALIKLQTMCNERGRNESDANRNYY